MASKPVKLQRPDSGHRVQSLLRRTWPLDFIEFSIGTSIHMPKSVKACTSKYLIAYFVWQSFNLKVRSNRSSGHRNHERLLSAAHPSSLVMGLGLQIVWLLARYPGGVHRMDRNARSVSRAAPVRGVCSCAVFRSPEVLLLIYRSHRQRDRERIMALARNHHFNDGARVCVC